jgi:hypothetical protein
MVMSCGAVAFILCTVCGSNPRSILVLRLWLQRRIAYGASAKRFTPSMVRNALRAMRRRRRRAFNTRIFHPIGS